MLTFREMAIRQLERDRADLQRNLEQMEAGRLTTGKRAGVGQPAVDTTADAIADAKRKIAALDAILARRDDA